MTPIPPWRACDRHGRLGHLVHRRGTSGMASVMSAAKPKCRRRRAASRVPRNDDDVVERQRLEAVEQLVIRIHRSASSRHRLDNVSTSNSCCSVSWARAVSESRVSSGRIGTSAVASTGPSTDSDGTRWTHHPGSVRSPAGSCHARSMADAGQFAGQRRVEVDHPIGEPAEEVHREDAHPPGEYDEVRAESGHRRRGGRRSPSAVRPAGPDVDGGTPAPLARARRRRRRVGTTATTSAGRRASSHVEDGLQVGARSRGQDDEASHHGSTVDGAPADSAELDEKSSR